MTNTIQHVEALQIFDSRGNPTLRVGVTLSSGQRGVASVPSGASTGENEAVELRDGDKRRYGGKGVTRAIRNVEDIIAPALKGRDPMAQATIDFLLLQLDGTANKAKLGANAMLGVSMAVARAAALEAGKSLYAYLNPGRPPRMPVPMMNVLNGGKHADSSLDFQEFMIVPRGAPTFSEAMRFATETFHTLHDLLHQRGQPTSVGDEGGFAPQLPNNEAACTLIVEAIEKTGYRPGDDIAIALDPAASSFGHANAYALDRSGHGHKSSAEMIQLYQDWIRRFPIVSLEDGLAEDDWAGFHDMTAAMGDDVQIVGDDIYVTNTQFIRRGIAEQGANAVLIKLNQIGTVTETIAAIDLCREAGWGYVISHRSGETEDSFMADFAVAMSGGQIKAGSLCRSERMAKYNRLLEIERELGDAAVYEDPFAR